MNKAELIKKLELERENFLDTLEGLTDEQYIIPGVIGEWSIKDILAHLSRWEAELVKLLWQARQGIHPTTMHLTQLDVDKTNHQWYQETKNRPLRKVIEDFHAVRNQTLLRVETFTDSELIDPDKFSWGKGWSLLEWIENDSFGHEAEHGDQIRAWRTHHQI